MKVYYAHSMGIYNTPQEKRDVETLKGLNFRVINPNNPNIQKECEEKLSGIIDNDEYLKIFDSIFHPLIDKCEVFAFKALPDGRIPSGIVKELQHAKNMKKLIIELPSCIFARSMGKEDTREYLRDAGQR